MKQKAIEKVGAPFPLPAAFRRLCVETKGPKQEMQVFDQPPSGGCVLKRHNEDGLSDIRAAAFRRLCVET